MKSDKMSKSRGSAALQQKAAESCEPQVKKILHSSAKKIVKKKKHKLQKEREERGAKRKTTLKKNTKTKNVVMVPDPFGLVLAMPKQHVKSTRGQIIQSGVG